MVKIDYFDIQLEAGQAGIFFAGQRVTGNVILRVVNAVKVLGPVHLAVEGKTRTFWVNKTSDKIYESFQPHLNTQLELPVPGIDEIPPGVHTIPFELNLPVNLLSTFEADYGTTRYTAGARLRIQEEHCYNPLTGGGNPEIKCEKAFSVLALVSRGIQREADIPIRKQEQTDVYGILGRKKGTIDAEIAIPHQNFKLMEPIDVFVHIRNRSSQKIKAVDLYLLQHSRCEALSRYEAVGDVKEINRAVECVALGEVAPKSEQQFKFSFPLKAIPPSQNAAIVNISYFLRLDYQPGNEIVVPIAIYSVE